MQTRRIGIPFDLQCPMLTPTPTLTNLAIPSLTAHSQHLPSPSTYSRFISRFCTSFCNPFSPTLVFRHCPGRMASLPLFLHSNVHCRLHFRRRREMSSSNEYLQPCLASRPQSCSPTHLHHHCCSPAHPEFSSRSNPPSHYQHAMGSHIPIHQPTCVNMRPVQVLRYEPHSWMCHYKGRFFSNQSSGESNRPSSRTRSVPHRLPYALERIHRRQISLSDFELGSVSSLPTTRFRSTPSRGRTIYSNRGGPPSLTPHHRHLQDRAVVRRTRTSFVARASRSCAGMYVFPRSSWWSEALHEARIHTISPQTFVDTLRLRVLRTTHLCTLPERCW